MNYPRSSLEGVRQLLNENRVQEAMEALRQNHDTSPPFQNARAVCWMRMGQPQRAAEILTPLVYRSNSVAIDDRVSEPVLLNLVTARLLMGNVSGAMDLLREVPVNSPRRQELEAAIGRWKRTQSIFNRIALVFGMRTSGDPMPLDNPPGEP